MPAELSSNYQATRRAYELGRLRSGLWKASGVAVAVTVLGLVTAGSSVLVAVPVTVAAWVFAFWRGDAFLRGAVYGLLGGTVTSLLPMSVLRPCCAASGTRMASGVDCCTMPGACLAVGALVGVVLAAVVPFGKASWRSTAMGVTVGTASVAILKCTTLFAGEAFGLVAGLLAGLAAATAAKAVAQP